MPRKRTGAAPVATRTKRTDDEKRAIITAAMASGNMTKYAKDHGIGHALIWTWRRLLTNGVAPAPKPNGERPRISQEEQRRHVDAAFRPGVSPTEYAKAHGVNASSLYFWFRKLKGKPRSAASEAPDPVKRVPEAAGIMPAPANGAARAPAIASPASMRAQVEQLRIENTVLKSVLRLAEMRGFKLTDLETGTTEEEGTHHDA